MDGRRGRGWGAKMEGGWEAQGGEEEGAIKKPAARGFKDLYLYWGGEGRGWGGSNQQPADMLRAEV